MIVSALVSVLVNQHIEVVQSHCFASLGCEVEGQDKGLNFAVESSKSHYELGTVAMSGSTAPPPINSKVYIQR